MKWFKQRKHRIDVAKHLKKLVKGIETHELLSDTGRVFLRSAIDMKKYNITYENFEKAMILVNDVCETMTEDNFTIGEAEVFVYILLERVLMSTIDDIKEQLDIDDIKEQLKGDKK